MSDIERIINSELVREACAHRMFCPLCGTALDCGDAVLISHTEKPSFVLDGECYDKKTKGMVLREGTGYEILDGRTL